MMQTEAFVLKRFGSPDNAFSRETVNLPALAEDELLIACEAFGLNYADIMARQGLYRETPPLPCVIGYEVAGRVVAAGANAGIDIGTRVVAFTRFGGYACHAIAKSRVAVPIADLESPAALALATQAVTAIYMAEWAANVQRGDRVLIHAAAGGVGSMLIQLCAERGATVVAKVSSEEKAQYCRDLGAHHVVNYTQSDYNRFVGDLFPDGIDVVFNPVGGKTFPADFAMLRAGGKIVLFGGSELKSKGWKVWNGLNFVRKMKLLVPIALMMRSRSVIGVNMLKLSDERPEITGSILADAIDRHTAGRLQVAAGQSFSDSMLKDAHELLESGKSMGKISVIWSK